MQWLQENNWILLMAGVVFMTMWMMMRLSRRQRVGQGVHLSVAERTEEHRRIRGMRGDMETLMVEIEQMAKRLGAQLDAKTIHLEKLLDEADEKLRQMRKLLNEPRGSDPQLRTDNAPPSQRPAPTYGSVDPVKDDPPSPASPPRHDSTARPSEAEPPGTPGLEGSSSGDASADEPDRLTRHVHQLADRGMDPLTIARELNEHVGKVELILALRKA